jgi:hypothetical protein
MYFVMFCGGRETRRGAPTGQGEWSTVACPLRRIELTGNCALVWAQLKTSEEVWRWLVR